MMANLVANSGDNKGQLAPLVEAICRDFRQHDKEEEKKYQEWQRLENSKGKNQKGSLEPIIAYRFPPTDTTRAGFLKNAIALEAQGGLTQYFNLPEVEMADQLCGSHKHVSLLLRNVYDRARAGALRATKDGITGNPILRACITISSNPDSTRRFYKYELSNGTFGRMVFSYKPRGSRNGRIPRQGKYTDEFYQKLDEYLARLAICKGRYIIRPLNKLIDNLAQDMATLADLTDDDVLFEMSHRSLVSGWKAGCVMWALNGQTWTKSSSKARKSTTCMARHSSSIPTASAKPRMSTRNSSATNASRPSSSRIWAMPVRPQRPSTRPSQTSSAMPSPATTSPRCASS